MNVERLSYEQAAEMRHDWNRLAGAIPFRQWEWLGTWWQHFGNGREWLALAIRDNEGSLRGIAPWCITTIPAFGPTIEFLGSGEACSDYLSLLCSDDDTESVTSALANWLMDSCHADEANWDIISFESVPADCHRISQFVEALERRDCITHERESASTWRVPLAGSWSLYLKSLSKPNRRHARTLQERLVDSGIVTLHASESVEELEKQWPEFVDLHQRRQQSLGKPGCFASGSFGRFVHDAAQTFQALGQLELLTVHKGNQPIAAQLAFTSCQEKYAYQVGIDPSNLADSPGWLVHTQSMKRAIEHGYRGFDFLRGNEPHKQRMGAEPRAMKAIRIVPPRLGPAMLHKAWMTGNTLKNWIKVGLEKSRLRQK